MTAHTSQDEEILKLHFKTVQKIEIITENDRYQTTLAEMRNACKASDDFKTWKQEFEGLLADVRAWSEKNSNIVLGSYIAATQEGLKIFITTRGDEFRFDFADEVTDLELRLDRVYPTCPVEILQMPMAGLDSLHSFFSPKKAYEIYGESESTPGQGG